MPAGAKEKTTLMKKYTKEELKQAFQKLAADVGLPAEQITAFNTALDHDGFASKVATELVMTRADYSRVLNEEVAPAKAKYESKYDELVNTWYPDVRTSYDKAIAAKATSDARIKQYEAQFGPIDDTTDNEDGTVRTATGSILRKADVEKLLADARVAAKTEAVSESVGLSLLMNELQADHWTEFKEILDLRPLTTAVKARRDAKDMEFSLRDAYSESFGPKIEEKRQSARKKELDDAVETARRDERSKFASTPAAVVDEESAGPFFAAQAFAAKSKGVLPTEAELEADFVNGMREGERALASTA